MNTKTCLSLALGALASFAAMAEDLTVSSDTTISEEKTYDNVTINEDVTLTLKGKKAFHCTGVSGAGTLVLDSGYIYSTGSAAFELATPVEVKGDSRIVRDATYDLTVSGSISGSGNLLITASTNATSSQTTILTGNNGNFSGIVSVDNTTPNRLQFGNGQSAFKNGTFACDSTQKGILTIGALTETTTFEFGSFTNKYTRSDGNYIRLYGSSADAYAIVKIGALNKADSMTLRYGDNDASMHGRLVKVGTGTMKLGRFYGQRGIELQSGTLELVHTNAVPTSSSSDGFTFAGGTLKYGRHINDSNVEGDYVTENFSAKIKNSTGVVKVETIGQDVTWSTRLDAATGNAGVTGFEKSGAGSLKLGDKQVMPASGTVTVSGGTLEFPAYNTHITNQTVTVAAGARVIFRNNATGTTANKQINNNAAKFLGSGTIELASLVGGTSWRVSAGDFSDFSGKLEFSSVTDTAASEHATGILNKGDFLKTVNVAFTGAPTSLTRIGNIEASDTLTLGSFSITNANAMIYVKYADKTISFGDAGDSVLNGTLEYGKVKLVKTGSTRLTIGSGFTVVDGSSFAVNAGTLELKSGVTQPSYMTIADNVALCGEGTFGTVDLSKHDLVFPVTKETADKTQTYTLLNATSVSGEYTTSTTDALAALNAGETKGKWVLTQVAGDSTTSVQLSFVAKKGLMVILR